MDFLLNLINFNEQVNWGALIAIAVGYFVIIWFVVSGWVYFDARKRYANDLMPFLLSIFVLVFLLPALIFYIMIRPEHTLEEDYYMNLALSGEKELKPIYFEGERGFDISINLSVQPKTTEEGKHTMTMDVEWMPHRFAASQAKQMRKSTRGNFVDSIGRWFGDIGDQITDVFSFKKLKARRRGKEDDKSGKVKEQVENETKSGESEKVSDKGEIF